MDLFFLEIFGFLMGRFFICFVLFILVFLFLFCLFWFVFWVLFCCRMFFYCLKLFYCSFKFDVLVCGFSSEYFWCLVVWLVSCYVFFKGMVVFKLIFWLFLWLNIFCIFSYIFGILVVGLGCFFFDYGFYCLWFDF